MSVGESAAARARVRVGDVAWEVEWVASIPQNEFGDWDIDRADTRSELYATPERAESRAREVVPLSALGCAIVTPMRFVAYDDDDAIRWPHVGYWEATGDSEEFSGQ